MSINEIVNVIKRNMYIPEELEKILLELSDEEWNLIKQNSKLRKIIEEALGKDTIDKIEKKRSKVAEAKGKTEERYLKAQVIFRQEAKSDNNLDYTK